MSVFLPLNNTALFLTPFPVSGARHKESDRRSEKNTPKTPERRRMSPSAVGIFTSSPGSRGRAAAAVWSGFSTWKPRPVCSWSGQAQRAPCDTSWTVPSAPGTQERNKCPFDRGRGYQGCPEISAPGLLLPALLISGEGSG